MRTGIIIATLLAFAASASADENDPRVKRAWKAKCASCHGEDLAGGKSQVSCLTCHAQGVNTCATCHARLPAAHRAHTQGTTEGRSFACSECHPQPRSGLDPGHSAELDGSARTAPCLLYTSY